MDETPEYIEFRGGLGEDQRDALQEIANIGMGQAGARLAALLGTFVTLSVPRISLVEVTALGEMLRNFADDSQRLTAVRQAFSSQVKGEAMALYDSAGTAELHHIVQNTEGGTVEAEQEDEVLFDVSNILIGACLSSIFEQIGLTLSFSPPRLAGRHAPVAEIVDSANLRWNRTLLMEIEFSLEQGNFRAHLLMLMAADSVETLKRALDQLLSGL